MAKAQAVATVQDSLPAERPDWMGDGSRGNEGVSTEDMSIPRLSIIQDLSPQHKKGKPEHIEGATPKMIFNTATQELYGERVLIVPILFRKEWVVWKDINKGGGFRGAFPSAAEATRCLNEQDDSADCEVVDTHQQFCLVIREDAKPGDRPDQAVISMSKSQNKVSRQLNSLVQAAGGDRFERMYSLEVVDDQNAAGNEYYNWKVKQLGYVSEELFKEAEKLYEAVRAGAMDVKRDQEGGTAHNEGVVDDNDDF